MDEKTFPTLEATSLAHKLERAGLSTKEALVYTSLLACNGAYPAYLTEITQLKRPTVYKVLLDLSVKGFVNEIERGRKLYYSAARPSILLNYTKHLLTKADHAHAAAKLLIPSLEQLGKQQIAQSRVTVYDGKDGVRTVYGFHLSESEPYEMVGFGNASDISRILGKKFLRHYAIQKGKQKITTRVITQEGDATSKLIGDIYRGVRPEYWPSIRTMPAHSLLTAGVMTLFGVNKVSIINMEATEPISVVIEDRTTHQMFCNLFELQWHGAKFTTN